MSLFRRRRAAAPERPPLPTMPGLAEAAATRGFQPATEPVIDPDMHDKVKAMSRVLHGVTAKENTFGTDLLFSDMLLRDAFRGTVEGRQVVLANAWTPIETINPMAISHPHGTSVVVIEVSTLLTLEGIEPRGKHSAFRSPEQPTGNADFDRAFRVCGHQIPGQSSGLVTPEVQQQILAHYDWAFVADGTNIACVGTDPFETPQAALRRVDEALAVVHALPAALVPDHVDHSFDDLLRRIDQLHSVDDAIAFLGTITDEERQRLAQSGTPLAAFADVRTPDEIGARFMELDVDTRLQVMAMFDKATGQG